MARWRALAGDIAAHAEVLAVVHRRDDARVLTEQLDGLAAGTTHLSALMCPESATFVLIIKTAFARQCNIWQRSGTCESLL